jgi:hypothetical protein
LSFSLLKEKNYAGEIDGTMCAVVNQQEDWLVEKDKLFSLDIKQPSLELVDKYTSGTILFILFMEKL